MTKTPASKEAAAAAATTARAPRGRPPKNGRSGGSAKRTPGRPPGKTPKRPVGRPPKRPAISEEDQGHGIAGSSQQSPKAAAGTTGEAIALPGSQTVKRRRTYTKRKHKLEKLDLDARVFFSNRLTARDADTGRFIPESEDRMAFEEARASAGLAGSSEAGIATLGSPLEPSTPSTPSALPGVGYQVKKIRIGPYEIDSWYISPYPDEYSRHPLLYICEFCLKYMKSEYTFHRHCLKCPQRHPPGDEIYRDGNISVFEVDGRKNKIYCQNLCLIGKMFLDTKTLYYDVEPFLFYILCEYDSRGYHFAGYYSKEKRSSQGYNLSCIMILPSKQREGYGKLLIEFSYLLSKKEGIPGSPEKPLSDFGLLSYRSYWRRAIYEILLGTEADEPASISIEDISKRTGMTIDDIISTLQTDGMLQRIPSSAEYTIVVDTTKVEEYLAKARSKNPRRLDPMKLRWTPFLTKAIAAPVPDAENNAAADLSPGEISV